MSILKRVLLGFRGHRITEWRAQKTRHMAGLAVFLVAGAGFRLRRDAAQLLLPLIATLRLRVNLLPRRFKNLANAPKMKRPTLFEGRPFFILVGGARLSNYMQIEIEPFPLVA